MKCPKCSLEQPDQNVECIQCGLIFEKYRRRQSASPASKSVSMAPAAIVPDNDGLIKKLFFSVKPETNPLIFGARVVLFLIILVWGSIFIFSTVESNTIGKSFWHLVNLPFHEAGHIIFRPLGRFMTSLGGTLGQLSMPLICLVVFIVKTRDAFAASFCLWWLSVNFMDIAPYINDARSGTLPLLGGNTGRTSPYGFHDWEFILGETGLLKYDHVMASYSYNLGTVLMIGAFIWGGYILSKHYKNMNQR
jgi:hypothetical protein